MLHGLIDFLFPPQCAACDALGSGLCERCVFSGDEPLVAHLATLRVRALGAYRGSLRRAVLALKDGRRDVAEEFARRCAALVRPGTLLVPVPTTAARRRVRGMDNVTLVAQRTAALAMCAALPALRRTGSDAQRGRNREARLAARGRFLCDASLLARRRVVLFDDVCTTGATLEDCAAAIRAAGGHVEEAVVVALA